LIQDKVEERHHLEYKQCAALDLGDNQRKTELSKDVSALANSSGGTIIYGIVEDKRLPTNIDGGLDPTVISKERLEQVILGNIRPRLQGLRINPVELTRSPGRVAYVVHVPQASTAHQASDKRYYKRFNFKSEAMEDYEIRDIMNRTTHPFLIPKFEIGPRLQERIPEDHKLFVTIRNEGKVRAQHVKFIFDTPAKYARAGTGFSTAETYHENNSFGTNWFRQTFQATQSILFPDDELILKDVGYWASLWLGDKKLDRDDKSDVFLYWKAYADDMPPRIGEVYLGDISRLY
jgi:hypothetical protein